MWNDPALGIDWPTTAPILSPRDQGHPPFAAWRAGEGGAAL
jgi:dTDP-4-dehydrorhamnose 3,5-epimerase